jgi:signal transduction histidine kinase
MQRMDFYNLCGLKLDESFTRRAPKGSFCVIKPVKHGTVDKFSSEIADIIAPSQKNLDDPSKTGFYDFVEYAVSELINNVNQHARGKGFISAQYYPKKEHMVQICIADIGMGIRDSFLNSHSPLSSKASSDRESIELALLPEASSKTHMKDPISGESENQGVGLTILREIIVQTGSDFVIVSGEAGIYISGDSQRQFTLPSPYKGTIVSFSFHRSKMSEYEKLLEDAKVKHGLGLSEMPEALSGVFGDG